MVSLTFHNVDLWPHGASSSTRRCIVNLGPKPAPEPPLRQPESLSLEPEIHPRPHQSFFSYLQKAKIKSLPWKYDRGAAVPQFQSFRRVRVQNLRVYSYFASGKWHEGHPSIGKCNSENRWDPPLFDFFVWRCTCLNCNAGLTAIPVNAPEMNPTVVQRAGVWDRVGRLVF